MQYPFGVKMVIIVSLLLMLVGALLPQQVTASQRLLIAKEADRGCDVVLWNPLDRRSRTLLTLGTCPDRLYVAKSHPRAFFLDGESIIQLSPTGKGGATEIAKVPNLLFLKYVQDLNLRTHPTRLKMLGKSPMMQIVKVGLTDDEVLWLHAEQLMPGDDTYNLLFKWVDQSWIVDEFVFCGRSGECPFAALADGDSGDEDKESSPQIWGAAVERNPFFVRDELIPAGPTNNWARGTDRYFDIAGQQVILEVWTGTGPDTGYAYTAGAAIRHSNGNSFMICDTQCSATLTGQFLLARRFWGGTLELYDISTGESVLGQLKFAIWMETPSNSDASP